MDREEDEDILVAEEELDLFDDIDGSASEIFSERGSRRAASSSRTRQAKIVVEAASADVASRIAADTAKALAEAAAGGSTLSLPAKRKSHSLSGHRYGAKSSTAVATVVIKTSKSAMRQLHSGSSGDDLNSERDGTIHDRLEATDSMSRRGGSSASTTGSALMSSPSSDGRRRGAESRRLSGSTHGHSRSVDVITTAPSVISHGANGAGAAAVASVRLLADDAALFLRKVGPGSPNTSSRSLRTNQQQQHASSSSHSVGPSSSRALSTGGLSAAAAATQQALLLSTLSDVVSGRGATADSANSAQQQQLMMMQRRRNGRGADGSGNAGTLFSIASGPPPKLPPVLPPNRFHLFAGGALSPEVLSVALGEYHPSSDGSSSSFSSSSMGGGLGSAPGTGNFLAASGGGGELSLSNAFGLGPAIAQVRTMAAELAASSANNAGAGDSSLAKQQQAKHGKPGAATAAAAPTTLLHPSSLRSVVWLSGAVQHALEAAQAAEAMEKGVMMAPHHHHQQHSDSHGHGPLPSSEAMASLYPKNSFQHYLIAAGAATPFTPLLGDDSRSGGSANVGSSTSRGTSNSGANSMLLHPQTVPAGAFSNSDHHSHPHYSHQHSNRLLTAPNTPSMRVLSKTAAGAASSSSATSGTAQPASGHQPYPVAASKGLSEKRFVAASAGWSQALFLTATGDVYQWQLSTSNPLTMPESSNGASNTLTTTESSATGDAGRENSAGNSANDVKAASSSASAPSYADMQALLMGPVLVHALVAERALKGVRIVSVSCGPQHCLALSSAPYADVYSWGVGADGRLGHGVDKDEPKPRIIASLIPYRVTSVSAGACHSACITMGGIELHHLEMYSAKLKDTYGLHNTSSSSSSSGVVSASSGVGSSSAVVGAGRSRARRHGDNHSDGGDHDHHNRHHNDHDDDDESSGAVTPDGVHGNSNGHSNHRKRFGPRASSSSSSGSIGPLSIAASAAATATALTVAGMSGGSEETSSSSGGTSAAVATALLSAAAATAAASGSRSGDNGSCDGSAEGGNGGGRTIIATQTASHLSLVSPLSLRKHAQARSGDLSLGAVWTWGKGHNGRLGHGRLENSYLPQRVKGIVRVAHRVLEPTHNIDINTMPANPFCAASMPTDGDSAAQAASSSADDTHAEKEDGDANNLDSSSSTAPVLSLRGRMRRKAETEAEQREVKRQEEIERTLATDPIEIAKREAAAAAAAEAAARAEAERKAAALASKSKSGMASFFRRNNNNANAAAAASSSAGAPSSLSADTSNHSKKDDRAAHKGKHQQHSHHQSASSSSSSPSSYQVTPMQYVEDIRTACLPSPAGSSPVFLNPFHVSAPHNNGNHGNGNNANAGGKGRGGEHRGARGSIAQSSSGPLSSPSTTASGSSSSGAKRSPPERAVCVQVACGRNFTVVVTADGDVWSWGRSREGQCGLDVRRIARACTVATNAYKAAATAHQAAMANTKEGKEAAAKAAAAAAASDASKGGAGGAAGPYGSATFHPNLVTAEGDVLRPCRVLFPAPLHLRSRRHIAVAAHAVRQAMGGSGNGGITEDAANGISLQAALMAPYRLDDSLIALGQRRYSWRPKEDNVAMRHAAAAMSVVGLSSGSLLLDGPKATALGERPSSSPPASVIGGPSNSNNTALTLSPRTQAPASIRRYGGGTQHLHRTSIGASSPSASSLGPASARLHAASDGNNASPHRRLSSAAAAESAQGGFSQPMSPSSSGPIPIVRSGSAPSIPTVNPSNMRSGGDYEPELSLGALKNMLKGGNSNSGNNNGSNSGQDSVRRRAGSMAASPLSPSAIAHADGTAVIHLADGSALVNHQHHHRHTPSAFAHSPATSAGGAAGLSQHGSYAGSLAGGDKSPKLGALTSLPANAKRGSVLSLPGSPRVSVLAMQPATGTNSSANPLPAFSLDGANDGAGGVSVPPTTTTTVTSSLLADALLRETTLDNDYFEKRALEKSREGSAGSNLLAADAPVSASASEEQAVHQPPQLLISGSEKRIAPHPPLHPPAAHSGQGTARHRLGESTEPSRALPSPPSRQPSSHAPEQQHQQEHQASPLAVIDSIYWATGVLPVVPYPFAASGDAKAKARRYPTEAEATLLSIQHERRQLIEAQKRGESIAAFLPPFLPRSTSGSVSAGHATPSSSLPGEGVHANHLAIASMAASAISVAGGGVSSSDGSSHQLTTIPIPPSPVPAAPPAPIDLDAPLELPEDAVRAVRVAVGHSHVVVCTRDGGVWGWGLNNFGQVGVGMAAAANAAANSKNNSASSSGNGSSSTSAGNNSTPALGAVRYIQTPQQVPIQLFLEAEAEEQLQMGDGSDGDSEEEENSGPSSGSSGRSAGLSSSRSGGAAMTTPSRPSIIASIAHPFNTAATTSPPTAMLQVQTAENTPVRKTEASDAPASEGSLAQPIRAGSHKLGPVPHRNMSLSAAAFAAAAAAERRKAGETISRESSLLTLSTGGVLDQQSAGVNGAGARRASNNNASAALAAPGSPAGAKAVSAALSINDKAQQEQVTPTRRSRVGSTVTGVSGPTATTAVPAAGRNHVTLHGVDPSLDPAVAVFAGAFHTVVATAGGALLAWGRNAEGALGTGSFDQPSRPELVQVQVKVKVQVPVQQQASGSGKASASNVASLSLKLASSTSGAKGGGSFTGISSGVGSPSLSASGLLRSPSLKAGAVASPFMRGRAPPPLIATKSDGSASEPFASPRQKEATPAVPAAPTAAAAPTASRDGIPDFRSREGSFAQLQLPAPAVAAVEALAQSAVTPTASSTENRKEGASSPSSSPAPTPSASANLSKKRDAPPPPPPPPASAHHPLVPHTPKSQSQNHQQHQLLAMASPRLAAALAIASPGFGPGAKKGSNTPKLGSLGLAFPSATATTLNPRGSGSSAAGGMTTMTTTTTATATAAVVRVGRPWRRILDIACGKDFTIVIEAAPPPPPAPASANAPPQPAAGRASLSSQAVGSDASEPPAAKASSSALASSAPAERPQTPQTPSSQAAAAAPSAADISAISGDQSFALLPPKAAGTLETVAATSGDGAAASAVVAEADLGLSTSRHEPAGNGHDRARSDSQVSRLARLRPHPLGGAVAGGLSRERDREGYDEEDEVALAEAQAASAAAAAAASAAAAVATMRNLIEAQMTAIEEASKARSQQRRNEEVISHTILEPEWERVMASFVGSWDYFMASDLALQKLWRQGIPPQLRGKVWPLAIGNRARITPAVFEMCKQRAKRAALLIQQEKEKEDHDRRRGIGEGRSKKDFLPSLPSFESLGHGSLAWQGSSTISAPLYHHLRLPVKAFFSMGREDSLRLIKTDLPRTFPSLQLFGPPEDVSEGPLYNHMKDVLGAFVAYRPDLGYVQGLSYIAALLAVFICGESVVAAPRRADAARLASPSLAQANAVAAANAAASGHAYDPHHPQHYSNSSASSVNSSMLGGSSASSALSGNGASAILGGLEAAYLGGLGGFGLSGPAPGAGPNAAAGGLLAAAAAAAAAASAVTAQGASAPEGASGIAAPLASAGNDPHGGAAVALAQAGGSSSNNASGLYISPRYTSCTVPLGFAPSASALPGGKDGKDSGKDHKGGSSNDEGAGGSSGGGAMGAHDTLSVPASMGLGAGHVVNSGIGSQVSLHLSAPTGAVPLHVAMGVSLPPTLSLEDAQATVASLAASGGSANNGMPRAAAAVSSAPWSQSLFMQARSMFFRHAQKDATVLGQPPFSAGTHASAISTASSNSAAAPAASTGASGSSLGIGPASTEDSAATAIVASAAPSISTTAPSNAKDGKESTGFFGGFLSAITGGLVGGGSNNAQTEREKQRQADLLRALEAQLAVERQQQQLHQQAQASISGPSSAAAKFKRLAVAATPRHLGPLTVADDRYLTFQALCNLFAGGGCGGGPGSHLYIFYALDSGPMAPFYDLFDRLLAVHNPTLAYVLRDFGIEVEMFLYAWWSTVFLKTLPLASAARVWDGFLLDGLPHLYRVAMALLDLLYPQIMQGSNNGMGPTFEDTIQLLTQSHVKAHVWESLTADNIDILQRAIDNVMIPTDIALDLQDLLSDPFFFRHVGPGRGAPQSPFARYVSPHFAPAAASSTSGFGASNRNSRALGNGGSDGSSAGSYATPAKSGRGNGPYAGMSSAHGLPDPRTGFPMPSSSFSAGSSAGHFYTTWTHGAPHPSQFQLHHPEEGAYYVPPQTQMAAALASATAMVAANSAAASAANGGAANNNVTFIQGPLMSPAAVQAILSSEQIAASVQAVNEFNSAALQYNKRRDSNSSLASSASGCANGARLVILPRTLDEVGVVTTPPAADSAGRDRLPSRA